MTAGCLAAEQTQSEPAELGAPKTSFGAAVLGNVSEGDVIAAIATPPGQGAIGMLRLSGPGSLAIAKKFLRWPQENLSPRTATLAAAYADDRLLDRVLVTSFPQGASYTGEDMIEVAAHGSPYILSSLLNVACRSGARLASPGEFTQRAFLNGRMDLSQAEAVCTLIRSKTRLAHRAAIDQMEGGLSRRLKEIRKELLDILAHIEAGLDHPEEDIPELDPTELLGRLRGIAAGLSALAQTYRIGKLTVDGARVAIIGAPNVGKSSLLNALLGHDRAIVTPLPGTTRDTLEEPADIDGVKALLIDTAGLREETSDPIEKIGLERSRRALASSDLVLLVLDRSRELTDEELNVMEEVRTLCAAEKLPLIAVLNKSDLPLPPASMMKSAPNEWGNSLDCPVEISALKGTGIDSLSRAISRQLIKIDSGEEGGIIITSLRHRQAIEDALASLQRTEQSFESGELAAVCIREALASIAVIIGETTTEDILHSIFSKFCIGK